jgi:hypothetical protein
LKEEIRTKYQGRSVNGAPKRRWEREKLLPSRWSRSSSKERARQESKKKREQLPVVKEENRRMLLRSENQGNESG